eukprot:3878574-Pyramimonas_sp.AAC.1
MAARGRACQRQLPREIARRPDIKPSPNDPTIIVPPHPIRAHSFPFGIPPPRHPASRLGSPMPTPFGLLGRSPWNYCYQ